MIKQPCNADSANATLHRRQAYGGALPRPYSYNRATIPCVGLYLGDTCLQVCEFGIKSAHLGCVIS